jgi:hypothetical protein
MLTGNDQCGTIQPIKTHKKRVMSKASRSGLFGLRTSANNPHNISALPASAPASAPTPASPAPAALNIRSPATSPVQSPTTDSGSGGLREVDEVEIIVSRLRLLQRMDYISINDELSHLLNPSNLPIEELMQIGGEIVYFSDLVQKINRFDISQERVLVVTNRAIYNFAKDKYKTWKRRIQLKDVKALVFSTVSDEVVIQVKNDYDYRYAFSHRADFCETVGKCYAQLHQSSLNVYLSEQSQLKHYTVSKTEFEKLDDETKTKKHHLVDQLDPIAYKSTVKTPKAKVGFTPYCYLIG